MFIPSWVQVKFVSFDEKRAEEGEGEGEGEMLTKVTTPIRLLKRFKTMRRQTGMIRSQRRNQKEKLRGQRRHYILCSS